MKRYLRFVPLVVIIILMLACNFNSSLFSSKVVPTQFIPTEIPASAEPETESTSTEVPSEEEEPTQVTPTSAEDGKLDPCSLLTAEQAEAVIGEPVASPKIINGSCAFSNEKDGPYRINIAVAQGEETNGILQGQTMLVMFAGNKVSDDFSSRLTDFLDEQNYMGFFSALVATTKDSKTMTAKLFTGGGNDLVYWAWINASPRHQGAFVAVRKNTIINMNVILPETAESGTLLKTLNNLAGEAFSKLPEKFNAVLVTPVSSIENSFKVEGINTPAPDTVDQTPQATPTLVSVGLTAPVLESPVDGSKFDVYPRNTVLKWQPVDGAASYLVEIMACSSSNTTNCFSHPMIEQGTRETTATTYTFTFIGAQPGKWRVIPMDKNGVLGIPSGWWTFSYSK